MSTLQETPRKAWRMLVLGVAAQTSGTLFVSMPAFLIPLLHIEQGIPLAEAGFFAAAPTIGMVFTLVAWGALADRRGERFVISFGLFLTTLASLGGLLGANTFSIILIFLVLGGAASASTNAASGRVVVGWFPRRRRGLAMGIRQMSQPLGVALAALIVPPLASNYGISAVLLLTLVLNLVLTIGCALGIQNPPRVKAPDTTELHESSEGETTPITRLENPYRADSFLWRIHAVSALLVIPQFTLSIFGLVWMVTELNVDETTAGLVIAGSQFIGAFGRVIIGQLSDKVPKRVGLLKQLSYACLAIMLILAVVAELGWQIIAIVIFVLATTVSVADNGLAFTSVAEASGNRWSGKALGAQNTGQFIAASAVGPGIGAVIGLLGYPIAFGIVALSALSAIPLVPKDDLERH